jgi:competence protein ComEC
MDSARAVTKLSRPCAPLAPVAISVSLGVLADRFVVPWETITWSAIAVCAGVIVLFVRSSWTFAAVLVAFVALGAAWHHHHWSDLAPDDLARGDWSSGGLVQLRGALAEVPTFRAGLQPHDQGATRTHLIVTGLYDGQAWHPASGRLAMSVPGDRSDLAMGQVVSAVGTLRPIEGPLNPGELDYRDLLRAEGIRLRLTVASPRSVWNEADEPDWPLLRLLGDARERSRKLLVDGLAEDVAPLGAALLLGRREMVDPADNDAFACTGTTHLLAISGLHLQVLAGLIWYVFRTLGLRRSWTFGAVLALTLLYGTLVGWVPSVARSAAMTVGVCMAGIFERQVRVGNLLGWAVPATLAWGPSNLFDVGCQLSFLGVAALCWGVPLAVEVLPEWLSRPLPFFGATGPPSPSRLGNLDAVTRFYEPRLVRALRWCVSWLVLSVLTSAVAWAVTLPVVVHAFHVVPLVGLFLNLPLVPLTSLALVASIAALLASLVWAPLGAPFAWLSSVCLSGTQWLVRWGAAVSWGHCFEPGPPAWWVIGFLGIAALAARFGPGRRPIWLGGLAWLLIGACTVLLPFRPPTPEADVLAVGHGLAVVVQGTDGRVLLYDCGKLGDPRVGRRTIAPALWSRQVRRIDTVILSHADSDHFNGLDDLLDRFSIGMVRVPPGFGGPDNPMAEALLERVRRRGVPLLSIAEGDRLDIEGTQLEVLHPPADWQPTSPDNARCLVLDLSANDSHVLLTGDLEGAGLLRVTGLPKRPCDILLAPHHGGRSSNPAWLYAWADPTMVIVSQSRPQSGTADFLKGVVPRHTDLLRTWHDGSIRLRWGPEGIAVRGFLEAPAGLAMAWPARVAIALAGVLIGLAVVIVLAIVTFGSWFLVLPGRSLQDVISGDKDDRTLAVKATDGVELRGAWQAAMSPRGTVVLLHGIGEDGSALLDRAEFLSVLGLDVLRPDSRGTGESGGTFLSYGGRESGDVRAWLDALPRRAGPIVLWGRSMGAAIALRVAAEDPRVAALVLEAPYADLTDAVALGLRRRGLPGLLATWLRRRADALAGVPIARPSPIELARSISVPVMVLQGGDDPVASPSEVQRLVVAFPTRPRSVETVPGARHADVFELGGATLRDAIASFLEDIVLAGRHAS